MDVSQRVIREPGKAAAGEAQEGSFDRYGRLLAYLYRDGRNLNRAQVRRGWAEVYVYGGRPFRQVRLFRRAARAARAEGRGIWGWDTARSLLNRVFTGDPTFLVGDFPGTLAVRRSSFLSSGSYDGDALFENSS